VLTIYNKTEQQISQTKIHTRVMHQEFSSKILNQLVKKEQSNMIVSSFSMYLALLMTANGATGKTYQEFEQVLHIQPDIESVNTSVLSLYEQLHDKVLSIANALFISDEFKINNDYLESISKTFRSEAKAIDVKQSEAARKMINQWVEKKTHDKIKDLLGPGSIDAMTRLVLVNAIYFKQDWAIQFQTKHTQKLPFNQNASTMHQVDTMIMNEQKLRYGSNSSAQWIYLPYKNKISSMVIVLPSQRFGLDQIYSDVLSGTIPVLSSGSVTKIRTIKLPKFKFEYSVALGSDLKQLGLETAFSNAEFNKISEDRISISEVIHKAFIQVDEQGTEAAAATAVMIRSLSMKEPVKHIDFICDQPFMFMIVHNDTSTVLFEGKVVHPVF
jgi:serpin B